MRSNFGQRNQIERPLREVGVRHFETPEVRLDSIDEQDIDVDRPRCKRQRALPSDREFDGARKAFERDRIEFGLDPSGHIEKARAPDTLHRRRFIEGGHGLDASARPQLLQGLQDVPLAVPEIRADAEVHRVWSAHAEATAKVPAGVRSTVASISSLFGKNSSASVSTTPAETALTRIPRGASSTAR